MIHCLNLVLLAFSLAGCGYHFGQGGITNNFRTISVPYAEGDYNGKFTTSLIKELSSTGPLQYTHRGGDLVLKVKLLDFDDKNIGFRYDRHRNGEIKQAIIPVETRLFGEVEVLLMDLLNGKTILGPVILSTTIDFDHDYYSSRDGINSFSLGQLGDYNEAYDAALPVLNQALSQKIVDYLYNSW